MLRTPEIPHQRRCRVLVEEFAGFDAYGVELRVSDKLGEGSVVYDRQREAGRVPRSRVSAEGVTEMICSFSLTTPMTDQAYRIPSCP